MQASVINGKEIAALELERLKPRVERLKALGCTPGLSVILVGENPASQVYVGNKERTAKALGFAGTVYRLAADTAQETLMELVAQLNADPAVHGILVQLPLPGQLDASAVLDAILPEKDVDGFHPVNSGRLAAGQACMVPCTPRGIIKLIKSTGVPIAGKHAVVLGRSNIVGKPAAMLLLQENATVTVCHSKTRELPMLARQADILVSAIGRADFVRADMVKPGAIVIDVGMNRNAAGKLCGDVAYEETARVAGYITPVPGGVGPMTIAMLMRNTLDAAARSIGAEV